MPNSFIGGFAEGANTGLRLRDYEQNRERQALRDRMAQESHDTRQRAANLQYDVAQQQLADQRGLRDLNQLEYSLQTGVQIPQAQRAYERMFGHYGDNVDQAEADVAELERAAASGEAGEQTRQAINRVYADEINKGGPANTYKEIADVWPTQDGVTFELEMTRPDGSKYRAPMTTPNRDETDTQVAVVPWDTLFTDLKARKAAIDMVRGRRVGLGDTAPLTELRAAEAAQAQRQQGLQDFMFKEDYRSSRRGQSGQSPWQITSLGDGRFVMFNKQTGERRLPTQEDLGTLGAGSGNVQVTTLTDDMGNKIPMERQPDGTWRRITPAGENPGGVGPGGMTFDDAVSRATAEARDRARFFSSDASDFGPEGRQGFITRRAQELYHGIPTGQTAAPAQAETLQQAQQQAPQQAIPAQGAQRPAAQQQPQAAQQPTGQDAIPVTLGSRDAMRAVLRQANPGASEAQIEAAVEEAIQEWQRQNAGQR